MELRKNISLVIGIAIPVVMILFVAASIYIPPLFVHPQYDFLYTVGGDDYYAYGQGRYAVIGGTLVKREIQPTDTQPKISPPLEPSFYVHVTASDQNRQVTFQEAQQLKILNGAVSPDGFSVEQGGYGGDFLFFGGYHDRNNFYLRQGNVMKRVTVLSNSSSPYYDSTFHFLAWIQH